ncbi:MAG: N-acetylglucosamine-6-phosphate deacetylase [Chloroflexi bacterium]|nr:N-acetylglucosamine-6-phosphate deacetylase [Chloroflexota bacterium]
MRLIIHGGTLLTPEAILPDHSLVIEDGRIVSIEAGQIAGLPEESLDATGLWVIPGMIDIHVHGAAGHETMEATPDALHRMARLFASHGVTGYLATTIAASRAATDAAVENVARTPQPDDGAHHLGAHLEGPYLSHKFPGAQPADEIRLPDRKEFERWLESGVVRLVTIAPEVERALDLIDQGVRRGIRFAVGHSAASYEQVKAAANHGLTQATHTFNAMLGLGHREPGTAGAVLADDRITAQLICDGIHVHPAVARLLIRSKGPDRVALITDGVGATGLGDGSYEQLGQRVIVKDGIARNEAGRLAGSTVTLDAALRNAMAFAGLSLFEALPMVTRVPAESIGLAGQKGTLAPGSDADVVLLDSELVVDTTIVQGRVVYKANSRRTNEEEPRSEA